MEPGIPDLKLPWEPVSRTPPTAVTFQGASCPSDGKRGEKIKYWSPEGTQSKATSSLCVRDEVMGARRAFGALFIHHLVTKSFNKHRHAYNTSGAVLTPVTKLTK